jgi:hypothetical protein
MRREIQVIHGCRLAKTDFIRILFPPMIVFPVRSRAVHEVCFPVVIESAPHYQQAGTPRHRQNAYDLDIFLPSSNFHQIIDSYLFSDSLR